MNQDHLEKMLFASILVELHDGTWSSYETYVIAEKIMQRLLKRFDIKLLHEGDDDEVLSQIQGRSKSQTRP